VSGEPERYVPGAVYTCESVGLGFHISATGFVSTLVCQTLITVPNKDKYTFPHITICDSLVLGYVGISYLEIN
jgi:hypothetical protein